jgi:hypothetical protein
MPRPWLLLVACLACDAKGGPSVLERLDARPAEAGCRGACAAAGERQDAAPDRDPAADAPAVCEHSIEAVIEAVDQRGQPFHLDAQGVFLVPLDADDFAFDAGKSRNVSALEVTYTFSSDCYPRVAVKAPVFGGFDTQGFAIDKRCQFMVEIQDLGCPEARQARADGSFRIVPPP